MTLLVSWIGVDSHGIASIYIASDSRVSWGSTCAFDQGRKVFGFKSTPDIIGYCGDTLFPSMAIDQAIELADHGLLFSHTNTCEERYNALAGQLQQHLAKYPTEYGVLAGDMFQVLFASRERGDSKVFKCFLLEYRNKSGWKSKEIELPQSSTVIAALGSGKPHFMKNYERYQAGLNNSTSRNVFHCFCDTIFSNADPLCGGAPQLVGLYRKPDSLPKQFGVIRNSCRYLNGMQITESPTFEGVEWRNDLFERCDGRTMLRLQDAQPQPDNLRTST